MSRSLAIFLVLSLMSVATGCNRLRRFEPGQPICNPQLQQELTDRLVAIYPDSITAMHRAWLIVGSRELVFTLCTSGSSEQMEMVGIGDFGKTLFVVRGRPGESWFVVRTLGGFFTDRRLKRLVSLVARMSLMATFRGDGDVRRGIDGDALLVVPADDGEELVISFDSYRNVQSGLLVGDGRVLASAKYGSWRVSSPWPQPAPSLVTIDDHRAGYRLSLELLSLGGRHVLFNEGGTAGELLTPPQ